MLTMILKTNHNCGSQMIREWFIEI